jgi:hypothetical protein
MVTDMMVTGREERRTVTVFTIISVALFTRETKSGFGSIIFPNQTRFEGSWQDSSAQGFGKILYNNGDIFEGEFK